VERSWLFHAVPDLLRFDFSPIFSGGLNVALASGAVA
jgi:hypothetical protein